MKKKTKLLILSVIATLAFTSAFAACGGKGGDNSSNVGGSESSSTPAQSESSSESSSDVVAETYAFTKVVNPTDRDGRVETMLEEGAALDLTAPAEVEGKVFEGWIYADGTAVAADAVMGVEPVTIYAKWEITPYTVTITLDGAAYKTLTFGVETYHEDGVDGAEGVDIIAIEAIGFNVALEIPERNGNVVYEVAGLPGEEGWKLENYTIAITSKTLTAGEALALGVANSDKVTNGTIVYNVGEETINNISYELAENYAHTTISKKQWGELVTTDNWYMGYGEDGLLWVVDDNDGYGEYKSNYEAVSEMVNGYAFEMIYDYTNTYYGIEAFLTASYALSDDVTESYEEGVWTYSVEFINASNYKYAVSVEFSLDEDDVISSATIDIGVFYRSSRNKLDAEGNPIPMVDSEGNAMTDYWGDTIYEQEYYYEDTADSTKQYVITQATDGEVTVKYNPEEVLLKSYTITDAEGEEKSEVDVVAGESVVLNMTDVAESANLKFESFESVVLDADGLESYNVSAYVSKTNKTISISASAAGTYTITITSAFVTKTLTVNVTAPATTEIYAYANWSKTTEASIYDDGDFSFEVRANQYADASATVEITSAPDGADASIEENGNEYTFYPDLAGTYVITITSIADDTVSSTVTITVAEAPSVDTILSGKYMNKNRTRDDNLYVEFYWQGDNAGLVLATYVGSVYDYYTYSSTEVKYIVGYSFVYDAETKTITLTAWAEESLDLSEFPGYTYNGELISSMTIQADYTIKVAFLNTMTTLVAWEEFDAMAEVAGDYRYLDRDNDYNLLGRWFLGLGDDGTGAFYYQRWDSENYGWIAGDEVVEFTWTASVSGDDYTVEITEITNGSVEGFVLDTVNSSITWGEIEGQYGTATGITFTFNGESLVLEKN